MCENHKYKQLENVQFHVYTQGGHGTWKTGNLDVNFSRQENTGNLVNLIFYTGKIVATQGQIWKFRFLLEILQFCKIKVATR